MLLQLYRPKQKHEVNPEELDVYFDKLGEVA